MTEKMPSKPILYYNFFFFFDHTYGMQNFPGQVSNLCHNSDNAGSLTTRPPGNSHVVSLPIYSPFTSGEIL